MADVRRSEKKERRGCSGTNVRAMPANKRRKKGLKAVCSHLDGNNITVAEKKGVRYLAIDYMRDSCGGLAFSPLTGWSAPRGKKETALDQYSTIIEGGDATRRGWFARPEKKRKESPRLGSS